MENQSFGMLSCFRNHKNKRKEGYFLKNGSVMLEQLIHSFNGNCNPIRMYSGKELKKATNDYSWDRMTHEDWNFQLYKGVHDDHEILVKKFKGASNSCMDPLELITNEAAVASNMSKQKNVLKLLGCCLETELPTLVYEFPAKGILSHHIYRDSQLLPWQIKLKIAVGVADAVAYLHYGMRKRFIHRHIKTEHIFLDQDYVAKLSEFQTSVPIPCGEINVDAKVFGAPHHFAPELYTCGRYNEKSDVYHFGIVLCDILTGKNTADLQAFEVVADLESTLDDRSMGQVAECTKLALWCLEQDPYDRPTMKD
ncbi:non-functional pseudokinase ZED1-like, partial [Prunus avium]|uniref:Non-functional pseudokinase ZED1-like n=1 Tax=Prunus avium TaxID=42229 RepID=A0A6P5RMN5_PRUAV